MNQAQHQQLKEAIKKIIRNEMHYKNNVGIAELMKFYDVATPKVAEFVRNLLDSTNPEDIKNGWKIVKHVLQNPHHEMNEDLKSMAAAGLIGLSALLPNTGQADTKQVAHAPIKHSTVSKTPAVDIFKDSIETIIKSYENSKSNPAGGYNKSEAKWYPHKSIEGGSDTIAYGHKVVSGEDFSDGITDGEALSLLKKDISNKESLSTRKISTYNTLPQYVKSGIINALYRGDLGPKTIGLMNSGEWDKVSGEYLNHSNYKSGKYPKIKERMKMNADAFDKYALELKSKK